MRLQHHANGAEQLRPSQALNTSHTPLALPFLSPEASNKPSPSCLMASKNFVVHHLLSEPSILPQNTIPHALVTCAPNSSHYF